MKRILLIAIVLLPGVVAAQKLLKPVGDRITNDTTWSTSKDKLYVHLNFLTQQGEGLESQVIKRGRSVMLVLFPQTLNEKDIFTVTEGQKAYLKLKDNSTVTLIAPKFIISDGNVSDVGNHVYSNGILTVDYPLTDDDIAKLKSSELTFVRVETSIGNFDCEIKSKFSQLVKKQLELITATK